MARPRTFDQQDILHKIADVFWRQGYTATRTEDLEAATGLKRGSIYNAFTDKYKLYLAALDFYSETQMQAAAELIEQSDSLIEGFERLLETAMDEIGPLHERRGCLVCDAAVELATTHPEVADRVQSALNIMQHAIQDKLAATAPWMSEREQSARAGQLVSSYMGLRVFAKAKFSEDHLLLLKQQLKHDLMQDLIKHE